MITHPSNDFNLFLYIRFNPKLPQQIVVTLLTHIPVMNLSVLLGEKVPCMVDRDSPFPQNPVFYHQLFSTAVADYGF